jgi:hypothetical protein
VQSLAIFLCLQYLSFIIDKQLLTLMQLGSIKKEFGLKELNTIELGPIYKNLDGIPVEIFVSMQSIESIDRKNKTTKSNLGLDFARWQI